MIFGTCSKITAAVWVSYSCAAEDDLALVIAEFKPAVVHLDNSFLLQLPGFTTRVVPQPSLWCRRCITFAQSALERS